MIVMVSIGDNMNYDAMTEAALIEMLRNPPKTVEEINHRLADIEAQKRAEELSKRLADCQLIAAETGTNNLDLAEYLLKLVDRIDYLESKCNALQEDNTYLKSVVTDLQQQDDSLRQRIYRVDHRDDY